MHDGEPHLHLLSRRTPLCASTFDDRGHRSHHSIVDDGIAWDLQRKQLPRRFSSTPLATRSPGPLLPQFLDPEERLPHPRERRPTLSARPLPTTPDSALGPRWPPPSPRDQPPDLVDRIHDVRFGLLAVSASKPWLASSSTTWSRQRGGAGTAIVSAPPGSTS